MYIHVDTRRRRRQPRRRRRRRRLRPHRLLRLEVAALELVGREAVGPLGAQAPARLHRREAHAVGRVRRGRPEALPLLGELVAVRHLAEGAGQIVPAGQMIERGRRRIARAELRGR